MGLRWFEGLWDFHGLRLWVLGVLTVGRGFDFQGLGVWFIM